ncbi:MAG: hypothetical protein ACI308_02860 [Muribaculaceae bacterium]
MKQYLLSYLKDVLWREPRMLWRWYRWTSVSAQNSKDVGQKSVGRGLAIKQTNGRAMVFCADGRMPHGGMFDRLKGAISVYAAAQVLHRDFRICFTSPFVLERYLEPNSYDWRLCEGGRSKSMWQARPVVMYGEWSNPRRLLKRRHRETHFYYGYDSLEYISNRCGKKFDWGELYGELFKPTAYLQQYIDDCKHGLGDGYVAVHLRFMNLLGDKMEYDIDPTLPAAEQQSLKARALAALREVIEKNVGYKVLLATDSESFSAYVSSEQPDVQFIPGEIKHIGTSAETSDEAVVKMFIDYYMIAGAKRVYNIVGPGMWPSAFPEYAAKIGRCPFERVHFE